VKGAEFKEEESALRIHIGIRKSAVIACPECGAATRRNGCEPNGRVWRHGDVMFCPRLIRCRRPKALYPHCESVQVNAPFERKNSRFTLLFEGYAMLILADMPIAKPPRSCAVTRNRW
jgi:transposase